jgi:RHS repeat-associated protein
MLQVFPGDRIAAQVYAKYLDATAYDPKLAAGVLLAAFAPVYGIPGAGEVLQVPDILSEDLLSGLPVINDGAHGAPKAYLNVIVFDKDFKADMSKSLKVAITGEGKYKPGSNHYGTHEQVALPEAIAIAEAGYVFVYLSNETPQSEVYFDDLQISHTTTPIVQKDDYYPFGLTFNSSERSGFTINNYLFNGNEKQDALGLDWLNYGARMYMPEICRFFRPDTYAEKYMPLSPYGYAANNPIMYVDINGDSLMLFKNGVYVTTVDDGKEEITGYNQESTIDDDGNETFTGGQRFNLNDQENDGDIISDLKTGEIKLNIVNGSDINDVISDRGVNDTNVISRWVKAWNESPAGGDLDFMTHPKIKDGTFNIINGTAYNMKDAGNYMWGFAMRSMGYTQTMATLAAHIHAWNSGKKENGQASDNWFENKSWGGDSEGDQRAIIKGMKDAGDYWKYKKKSLGFE